MERNTQEGALLVAQSGPLNGQRWFLRETLLIGRDRDCDVVVPDRQVSRHHARLFLDAKGVYLEDLGSKNGTHYNGQRITQAVLLQDGDIIQIALAQKFVFLSSDATVPLEDQGFSPMEEKAMEGGGSSLRRLRLDKLGHRVFITLEQGEGMRREVEVVPPLSVAQFRLLEKLYENQGKVISREELAVTVWGEEGAFEVSEQALDALVRRLRQRLAEVDPHHTYVVTVRGHGLRLENPPL